MSRPEQPLRILHVFRSPVGGLFRHVIDVVRGQAARGHHVGIVCDALTGGDGATTRPRCYCTATVAWCCCGCRWGANWPWAITFPRVGSRNVLHSRRRTSFTVTAPRAAPMRGSRSKPAAPSAPTPHGGSLLFKPEALLGRFYLTLEKMLPASHRPVPVRKRLDRARLYRTKVGEPRALARIVPNGVAEAEFAEVPLRPEATDVLFIGELRHLKGVDILLAALASLRAKGVALSATIVGDGKARLRLAAAGPKRGSWRCRSASNADACARGLCTWPGDGRPVADGIVSLYRSRSRRGGKPLIATSVGGIPDMFGPFADRLIPPDNREAMESALAQAD